MGLPSMTIIFKAAAREAKKRLDRGIVGMILKDTVPETNPATVYSVEDIPTSLSAESREQIQLALMGYVNAPKKVVVYVLPKDAENYKEALDYFSLKKVNWLCCPTCETDVQTEAVADWVRTERGKRNKVKAVLPECEGDSEGIINYATKYVTIDGDVAKATNTVGTAVSGKARAAKETKKYTPEQYCSRIAGLLAGTPAAMASTFAVLEDAADCERMEREEIDKMIDGGKFVVFHDGEKVKVARGVNSLQTITEDKSETWKKIKVVEIMDMIHDDLVFLVEDNYIGKYPNTYSNKCLVLSAIMDYLEEISMEGLLDSYTVDFDTAAIKQYIIEYKGVSKDEAEAMDEATLKKQNTDEKLFMAATLSIVDAIEDVTLNITV